MLSYITCNDDSQSQYGTLLTTVGQDGAPGTSLVLLVFHLSFAVRRTKTRVQTVDVIVPMTTRYRMPIELALFL